MSINKTINAVRDDNDDNSNDEDNDDYFLQCTAPSGYDIQEKIRTANDELFDELNHSNTHCREQKVTFNDNLVDYEPDCSSDDGYVHSPDILSVISDNENEAIDEEEEEGNSQETNYNLLISNNSYEHFETYEDDHTFFNTFNNKVDFSDIEEKIEEVVDVSKEYENEISDDESEEEEEEEGELNIDEEQHIEIVEIISSGSDGQEDDKQENIKKKKLTELNRIKNDKIANKNVEKSKNHIRKDNRKIEHMKINCRLHCLEKPQLDVITKALTKLRIATSDKSSSSSSLLRGPILKIRQRTCCMRSEEETKPKLPCYNGFISEYGLTKTQLERRIIRKKKAEARRKQKYIKVQEEKEQKDMYNEQIFSAWLKSLRNRNQKDNSTKESSPHQQQRPKTANSILFSPKRNYLIPPHLRKRPSTSPSKYNTYNITFR